MPAIYAATAETRKQELSSWTVFLGMYMSTGRCENVAASGPERTMVRLLVASLLCGRNDTAMECAEERMLSCLTCCQILVSG